MSAALCLRTEPEYKPQLRCIEGGSSSQPAEKSHLGIKSKDQALLQEMWSSKDAESLRKTAVIEGDRIEPPVCSQTGDSDNRHVFTGHEHDVNTGLVYAGARYYDPEIGRFITQDTYLGNPGNPPSMHRYMYAHANPMVYTDPTGHAALFTFNNSRTLIQKYKDRIDITKQTHLCQGEKDCASYYGQRPQITLAPNVPGSGEVRLTAPSRDGMTMEERALAEKKRAHDEFYRAVHTPALPHEAARSLRLYEGLRGKNEPLGAYRRRKALAKIDCGPGQLCDLAKYKHAREILEGPKDWRNPIAQILWLVEAANISFSKEYSEALPPMVRMAVRTEFARKINDIVTYSSVALGVVGGIRNWKNVMRERAEFLKATKEELARHEFSQQSRWKPSSYHHGDELVHHAYNRHPSLATNRHGVIDPALYDARAKSNIINRGSEIHILGNGRYAAFNPNTGEFTVFSWQGGSGLAPGTPTIHSYYVPLRREMSTGVPFSSQGITSLRDIRPN